jgi:hypothetical protein
MYWVGRFIVKKGYTNSEYSTLNDSEDLGAIHNVNYWFLAFTVVNYDLRLLQFVVLGDITDILELHALCINIVHNHVLT